MGNILDGRVVSSAIKEQMRAYCERIYEKYSLQPALAIVLVGNNPASETYVASKQRACEFVGVKSIVKRFSETATQEEVINEVQSLCENGEINGVMVQLPLPKGFDEKQVLSHVTPEKDVDGLTALNVGNLLLGHDTFVSCTPKGIISLLKHYNIEIAGKNAVVVGRSNMVGKPVAVKLLEENATVTVCHSKTKDLANITTKADILVVAIGRKHFITADMIKSGAVVIDVGINRVDGRLYGDVDFDNSLDRVSYITPVPGGVGLMTVCMLIENTLEAFKKQNRIDD